MNRIYKRIVLAELRKLKEGEAEYRADVDEWYRSGDGRRPKWFQGPDDDRPYNYGGKGYAYPYCEHGSSLWTDYDNICGGCEGDYGTVYERAIWSAKEKVEEYEKRINWLLSAPSSLSWEKKRELIDWASEPIR